MPQGKLIIVTGPSGVGKQTLIRHAMEKLPHCMLSISATTRQPRDGEVDGRDYYFLSRKAFEEQIAAGGFLEHAEYAGNLYGTPYGEVSKALQSGTTVMLEIEVQGAKQVMRRMRDAVSFFILPPEPRLETLRARLRARSTENEERINRRLVIAAKEMEEVDFFYSQLVNDDLASAQASFVRQLTICLASG